MLNFEQWFEVEKITRTKISIDEQFKECWEYSAKKTKEDFERSVIDEYENQISELDSENGILESENDDLSCRCDELEHKINLATKIIDEFLDFESSCVERGIYISDELRNKAKQFIKEN